MGISLKVSEAGNSFKGRGIYVMKFGYAIGASEDQGQYCILVKNMQVISQGGKRMFSEFKIGFGVFSLHK